MSASRLLHDLPLAVASRLPDRVCLTYGDRSSSYEGLVASMDRIAGGLQGLGLQRGQRVALYLEKRLETVAAIFGITRAGGVVVPVNPILRPYQVGHILRDCGVRVLITSASRAARLAEELAACPELIHLVTVDGAVDDQRPEAVTWDRLIESTGAPALRGIDADVAAILYTSGSTGRPKGVVLSHRNMVVGAESVAQYLGNHPDDVLLAALPLSFDAGLSQVTTAFSAGARTVLLNYLLPRDVIKALAAERVTGLTGVPTLWRQIIGLEWPESIGEHLRYVANTGGRMPEDTLRRIRERVPSTDVFLMYGLTEAFRATFLPPEQVDERPDSIGKAIPNAEVLVLRPDGTPCDADEPGELVQRGALVAMGYWNDEERTRARFKPLPPGVGRPEGLPLDEMAVYSGDLVRRDSEGYLYFVSRMDEMIKVSGYRVSPTEIEEIAYRSGLVEECVAFSAEDADKGQIAVLVVVPGEGQDLDVRALLGFYKLQAPHYMIPAEVRVQVGPLPRNPNGKLDRNAISRSHAGVA